MSKSEDRTEVLAKFAEAVQNEQDKMAKSNLKNNHKNDDDTDTDSDESAQVMEKPVPKKKAKKNNKKDTMEEEKTFLKKNKMDTSSDSEMSEASA